MADISCDIDGPVASTVEPSTIADPMYGYDPFKNARALPHSGFGRRYGRRQPALRIARDASAGFGATLVKHIIPLVVEGDAWASSKGLGQPRWKAD